MASGLQRVDDINGKPATIWVELTPSDTVNIPSVGNTMPRSIYATDAGNVACVDALGNVAIIAFAAGEIKPLRPVRINATDTDANTLIGLW